MKGAERYSQTHLPRTKRETVSLHPDFKSDSFFTGKYLSFPSKLLIITEVRHTDVVPLANVSLELCE